MSYLEYIVCIALASWFLIAVLHAFFKKKLKKFGHYLSLLGWTNEWSMFTNLEKRILQVTVFGKSTMESEWEEWKLPTKSTLYYLLNPSARLALFLESCLVKAIKKEKNQKNELAKRWLSIYSNVVSSSAKGKSKRYEQIKIQYSKGRRVREHISFIEKAQ